MWMIAALVLFAVAAVVGLVLVNMYSRGKLSLDLAAVHGLCAAVGLILLIVAAVQKKTSTLGNVALAIFVVAAAGGFVMFFSHVTKGKLPKPLIPVHAIAAVAAFLILLLAGSRGGS